MNVDDAPAETFGTFDFGLTPAQEARAAALHRASVVVDMVHQGAGSSKLFDLPAFADAKVRLTRAFEDPLAFMAEAFTASYQVDLGGGDILRRWWDQSGVTSGYLYVDVPSDDDVHAAALGRAGRKILDAIPWLHLAERAGDIRRAKAKKSHALVGYCQPVRGLPPDIGALNQAYSNGLRVLMLTYNATDRVGSGCTAQDDEGLTRYGREVVAWCNSNGVIVDTSHCGPRTTLDACQCSRSPVVANHSCASAIFAHPRAKSDEALRAIAATGGLVGVVAVPFFLTARPDASIGDMLDHIDHIAGLVGPQHVAIGSDWPLTGPNEGIGANFDRRGLARLGFDQAAHRIQATRTLVGFGDYRDFPNITRGLVARGYGDGHVTGILGENFLRVFAAVCGE